jgi:hypothetical protein
MNRAATAMLASGLVLGAMFASAPTHAEPPDALTLARETGISPADFDRVRAGEMVNGTLPPSHDRELVATFVFVVQGVTPTELVKLAEKGLLEEVDPNTLAFGRLEAAAGPPDFAKLTLAPDAEARAKAYASAQPGAGLNLSTPEIAAFQKLGARAPAAAVEQRVRDALAARLAAYRSKGLAGIAPYAREGSEERSPAEDLRLATRALEILRKQAPGAYRLLLEYPDAKPPGTGETFLWSQISAYGEPTIVLTHHLYVPDGEAWVVAQRQFYVSTGYNCEQAVAAFLPVQTGTAVLYVNRTSTDQVVGFGGGAKRSLGSRVLASSLEALFQKARARVAK